MGSLQILKHGLTPSSFSLSYSPSRKSYDFCSEFKSQLPNSKTRFLSFQTNRSSKVLVFRSCRISCKVQEGDNKTNGEEPPESLFMKELRKRGMTPTSLLEETNRSVYDEEIKLKEEEGGYSKRNASPTDYEKSLSNQRERSMALNSEGLEGLIPRAKLLLSIGGTFFLGFGPLILITVASFSALYLYFGPTFVHDASKTPITPPQYIDPYVLLQEERISQMDPLVN